MALSSREFRLALRFLFIGYALGYFGIVNTIYGILAYVLYKLMGFDLMQLIIKLVFFSGEVWAILHNKMAEYRGSPKRISADIIKEFLDGVKPAAFYAKLLESEDRLVIWLGDLQHRRVGEIFGIEMETTPVASSSIKFPLPLSLPGKFPMGK